MVSNSTGLREPMDNGEYPIERRNWEIHTILIKTLTERKRRRETEGERKGDTHRGRETHTEREC